ncbi:hypothetical protein ACS0TY_019064 [Phlomoides rotata]
MGRASPSDSDINRCNEAFWRRNCVEEASFIFENNMMMGFSIEKDMDFLVPKLIELEERDREKMKAEQDKNPRQRAQGNEDGYLVCFQETKRDIINTSFCDSLWPDKDFGWAYSGSSRASGGLITFWRSSAFTLLDQ